jgi:hypothetical protein
VTSQIDSTVPIVGNPTTASVRSNFDIAAQEISALQTALATAQNDITALQNNIISLQNTVTTDQNDIVTLKTRQEIAVSQLTTNPPNTSSTAFVTAGIGVAVPSPANSNTRAIVIVTGQLGNIGNGNSSVLQLVWGQGSSPTQGTLVTATNGTLIGGTANMMASKPNDIDAFSVNALLTGLVPGQTFWVDAAYSAVQGTATLSQMTLTIFEVLDPLPVVAPHEVK